MGGTHITLFAMPLIAVLALDADAWEMGVVKAAGATAPLLLALPAGAAADRYERLSVMHGANLGRLAVLVTVPLLFWGDLLTIWVLALAMLVIESLTLLFDSARSAYVPSLVPKRSLSHANSWVQGSVAVGDVAGPGAAGLLVQLLSAPVVLLIDAATYLFSSVMIRTLPRRRPVGENDHEPPLRAIRLGVALLRRDRVQFPLTLAAAHSNLFHAMFFTLFVLYAVRELEFSPTLLGATSVVSGAAGLLAVATAPWLMGRVGHGRTAILTFAVPGPVALLVPLAAGVQQWAAVGMVTVVLGTWSYAVVVNLVVCETVKQALVPGEFLGRVTATIRLLSWGVEPVGALVGGTVAMTALGTGGTLVLACAGLTGSVLWALRREVRTLTDLGEPTQGEDRSADAAPTTDPGT